MRKLIIILVAVVAVGELLVGVWMFSARTRVRTDVWTTLVKVSEGRVDLFRLGQGGKREFVRTVSQGETAEISVSERVRGDGGVLAVIGPMFPRAVSALSDEISSLAPDTRGEFTRTYSESNFNGSLSGRIVRDTGLGSLKFKIEPSGFSVEAVVRKGWFRLPLRGRGLLGVDGHRQLHLDIQELYVGPVPTPRWVLHRLEDSFYQSVRWQRFAIEIRSIEYRAGEIIVTGRRASRLSDAE